MKSYKISYDKGLGWVIEVVASDFDGKEAIVLEDREQVAEFLDEFKYVFENSMMFEWTEAL